MRRNHVWLSNLLAKLVPPLNDRGAVLHGIDNLHNRFCSTEYRQCELHHEGRQGATAGPSSGTAGCPVCSSSDAPQVFAKGCRGTCSRSPPKAPRSKSGTRRPRERCFGAERHIKKGTSGSQNFPSQDHSFAIIRFESWVDSFARFIRPTVLLVPVPKPQENRDCKALKWHSLARGFIAVSEPHDFGGPGSVVDIHLEEPAPV